MTAMLLEHIRLMAAYNQQMNRQVYGAAAGLSEAALRAPRGAFFGSILGTLNHLMIGDVIWLKRLSVHPGKHSALDGVRASPLPASLDALLYPDFAELDVARTALDQTIIDFCAQLSEADLPQTLRYQSMNGQRWQKRFSSLLLHLFNHQTHHRGQVSTLLTQQGIDIGVTDLLALIPEQADDRSK